jgi:hypothetical protein
MGIGVAGNEGQPVGGPLVDCYLHAVIVGPELITR